MRMTPPDGDSTALTIRLKERTPAIFSAEALEKIAELESRENIIPTLQEVLSQQNLTNIDIVLTNGENDAIDISPNENRIVIASVDDTLMPRISLVHAADQDQQSHADIELDEQGRTLDFDMEGAVEEIRFRFGDSRKFSINNTGDATFTGRVRLQAGVTEDEAATFGQIKNLRQEIDQMAPTMKRGSWEFDDTPTEDAFPGEGSGQYVMYSNVNTNPSTKTQNWEDTVNIVFHKVDAEGTTQNLAHYSHNKKYINIFNVDNSDYAVFKIVQAASLSETADQMVVEFIESRGVPSGRASVKIYDVDAEIDEEDLGLYLRKTGDTMEGNLDMGGNILSNSTNVKFEVGETIISKDNYFWTNSSESDQPGAIWNYAEPTMGAA